MTTNQTTHNIVCPNCGAEAQYTSIELEVALYTLEYDDDGWPEIETVTARGFTADCGRCGWADGEAPQI